MKKQSEKTMYRLRVAVVALAMIVLSLVGVSAPAMADDGGYPYATVGGAGATSTDSLWYDSNKSWYSSYGYAYRNCTDYVAWKLSNTNGFSLPRGIGNAADWGVWATTSNAGHATYTVDSTAAVGAVAWWGANKLDNGSSVQSFGHVAWVSAVTGSSVSIQEYNNYNSTSKTYDGAYHTRTITAGTKQQVQYIHFKDMPLTATLKDGDFVKTPTSGTVYVMAGGAALTVTSWANVGNPSSPSVQTITQAQFDGLRKYPPDGTTVVDNTGTVYVIAGGSATVVSSFANIPPVTSLVHVDGWAVHNQLLQYPLDGTTVVDSTGTVYVIAGGSALVVTSFANIPPVTSLAHIDGWAVHNQFRAYPADGTTVVDTTGTVYVIAGKSAFTVTNFANIPPVTSLASVDSWAIHNQLLQYPVDGTTVVDTTGTVYVIAGGAATTVTSYSNIPPVTSLASVDSWAIHNQLLQYPKSGTYLKGYGSGITFVSNGSVITQTSANSGSVSVDDWAIIHQLGGTE